MWSGVYDIPNKVKTFEEGLRDSNKSMGLEVKMKYRTNNSTDDDNTNHREGNGTKEDTDEWKIENGNLNGNKIPGVGYQ